MVIKPSKYSVVIIPNSEAKSRQFNISRRQIISSMIVAAIFVVVVLFVLLYALPKLMKYKTMESKYNQYVTERVQIMELMQDMQRIEQMDQQIRQTLGSELDLSAKPARFDSSRQNFSNQSIIRDFTSISYVDNIPSQVPVKGFITQKVNTKSLYKDQNHYGIDIAVKEGEPINAVASGFVVFAGWTFDFGNMLILYHGDDYFSLYGHNKNLLVRTMDFVKRGDEIAISGSSGIASGPHLHFEIWKNGIAMDPLEYFPQYELNDMSINNE